MDLARLVLALALVAAPAAAEPPSGPALVETARAHAAETYVALVACEDYRAQLAALRDKPPLAPEMAAALPALLAARERELAVLRALGDAVRDPARSAAVAAVDPELRAWAAGMLATGPSALFDGWLAEGAARGRPVGPVVSDLVRDVAARVRPRDRPPLFPLVAALAAGVGGALWWRRRRDAGAVFVQGEATRRQPAGLPAELVGALAERYDGLATLGVGGMGVVLRARDRVLGRDVAIKVPHASVRVQPDVLARFLREARALASLEHPAIVRILDVHATEPVYYTMELVEGGTLAERLDGRTRWAAADALAVMGPVAEALAACHRAGLVHRDVKPANLLLDRAGAVRLSDFGLAFLDGATRITLTDQVMGTPGYLAPEVLEGGRPTPACDVHAWGLVLYDLLTGDPDARDRKLAARLTSDLAPIGVLRPELDAELAALVMDCAARAPERRPADGAALVERLARIATRDAGAAFAQAATRLDALVTGPLHTAKNRGGAADGARGASAGDADTVRADAGGALAALAAVPGLAAEAAAAARALGDAAGAAPLGELHARAAALLADLALPLRPALDELVRRYPRRARLTIDLPPPPIFALDRAGALADLALCAGNWIDNALEAGAEQVDVVLGGDAAAAWVRVTNDGPPLEPAARALVFREPLPARGPGRGTGLLTVARAARARGWSVALEDAPLTTFRLTLPAR